MVSHSDAELYQAFDVCYDYDIYGDFLSYVEGKTPLSAYVEALERQEGWYPADYVKLRFLENHDRPRMAFLFPDKTVRMNWLAWMFFQKGMALLYGGQEWECVHRPDLFDPDPVPMKGTAPLTDLLRRLTAMKKDELFSRGAYTLKACPGDVLLARWELAERQALGIFSLKGGASVMPVDLPDGAYESLLDGRSIPVESGLMATDGQPIILITDKR